MSKEYFKPVIVPQGATIEGSFLHVVNITDLPVCFFTGTGSDWIGARKIIAGCSGRWGGIYRTKETNPTSGDYVMGWIYRPIRRSVEVDVQMTFLFPNPSVSQQIEEEVVLPDLEDAKPVYFKIKITTSDKKVYYLNEENTYTELGTLHSLDAYAWNYFYMEIDRLRNQIKALYINDQVFIESPVKAYKNTSADSINYRKLTDILTTLESNPAEYWIDEIIFRVI